MASCIIIQLYIICMNIKGLCKIFGEIASFAKFANSINGEHFVMYGIYVCMYKQDKHALAADVPFTSVRLPVFIYMAGIKVMLPLAVTHSKFGICQLRLTFMELKKCTKLGNSCLLSTHTEH